MRQLAVAIFTLAALIAGNLSYKAMAQLVAQQPPVRPKPATTRNYVVPSTTIVKPAAPRYVVPVTTVTPATPKPSAPIVPAENQQTKPQFAGYVGVDKNKPKNSAQNDLALVATDVQILGVNQELQQVVRSAIRTRLGSYTSQSQIQNDVKAILATGFFANASVNSTVNSLGLKVVYQVQPIVARSLQLSGAQVLTPSIANEFFKPQLGAIVTPSTLKQGMEKIKQWYIQNGYSIAQVLAVRPNPNGVVTIEVAEGLVSNVNIRFIDKKGQPTKGRTKESFLRQELQLKPGQVFRVDVAQKDVQQLYQLGLFDKAEVALNGDARKVDVIYELREKPSRAINGGAGYNDDSGLFALVTYSDQNFSGVNQQIAGNLQISRRDLQFSGRFTSPYRASNPKRPGYSINGFRQRGVSFTFDDDIKLANGDRVREGKFGGGVTFTRPINDFQASVGFNYTRTSLRDRNGKVQTVDAQGNPLSFSGTGVDDLVTVSAAIVKDRRNNFINPSEGSILNLSTEQSIPIGLGNILMNRLQGNYSQYLPLNLLGSKDRPEVLAFNVQGGTTLGDLPPYQAFNLGGSNSVRGYGLGDVASGRSYVLASAEYRFPIYSYIGGVLFADYGSDLGSGDTVLGEPGVVRGKPGSGFGYGAGVRLNSPIGVIRADFGFNDQGDSRLQLGIGQRF